jgi:hypothetical protein
VEECELGIARGFLRADRKKKRVATCATLFFSFDRSNV